MKHSRQRDTILHYLETRKDHPTAEQVYEAVREEIPNISLGTVYRNLALLAENRTIGRVVCEENGADHFDYDTTPHQHFCCRICGAVMDVPLRADESLMRMLEQTLGVRISEQKTIYYGCCKKCLSTSKNEAENLQKALDEAATA